MSDNLSDLIGNDNVTSTNLSDLIGGGKKVEIDEADSIDDVVTTGNVAVETKKEVSFKFENIHSFLMKNKDKFVNSRILDLKQFCPEVNEDKQILVVSYDDEKKNGSIGKIDNPTQLNLVNTDCDQIKVFPKSGIMIISKTHRSYITATKTFQYILNSDGYPVKRFRIFKAPVSGNNPKIEVVEVDSSSKYYTTPQEFSVGLKNNQLTTLYNQITNNGKIDQENLQSLDLVKEVALSFLSNKKDISYLLKLEEILLYSK